MRILSITTNYPRFYGDRYAPFIHELQIKLSKKGYEIFTFAPYYHGSKYFEIIDGIYVFRIAYFLPLRAQKLFYRKGLLQEIKKNKILISELFFFILSTLISGIKYRNKKFDIIHAHWVFPSGLIGIILSAYYKVPCVITAHGSDIRSIPECIPRFILSYTQGIISPHPETSELLENLGFISTEIPNLVSINKNAPKIRLGTLNQQIITFIGRLEQFKDPITLLKSIPDVIKVRQDVHFVIVGEGPLEKEMQNYASEKSLGEYLSLLGHRDDISSILISSDIFIAISPVENIWSSTIVEAMSLGIPCIISKAGKTEQFLHHGFHALMVEPGDSKNLALTILTLLDNPSLREKLINNAQAMISEIFYEEKIVNLIIDEYSHAFRKFKKNRSTNLQ